MMVWVVEEIALQMPGLAIHLPPFGPRIEHGHESRKLYSEAARAHQGYPQTLFDHFALEESGNVPVEKLAVCR